MPGFLILRRTRGGQEASHFDQRSGWARARTREERLEREEGGRGREGRERRRLAGEVCFTPVGQSNSGGNVGCLQGVTTGSDWGDM